MWRTQPLSKASLTRSLDKFNNFGAKRYEGESIHNFLLKWQYFGAYLLSLSVFSSCFPRLFHALAGTFDSRVGCGAATTMRNCHILRVWNSWVIAESNGIRMKLLFLKLRHPQQLCPSRSFCCICFCRLPHCTFSFEAKLFFSIFIRHSFFYLKQCERANVFFSQYVKIYLVFHKNILILTNHLFLFERK